MQLSNIIKFRELLPYLIIGTIATAIDWSLFAVSVNKLQLHYQTALVFACLTAAIFHYIANKLFTFKCHSKQLGSQFSLYAGTALLSLLSSIGIMAILVNFAALQKIDARILTTILMILPNYLLHKHVTFNRKIFSEPSASL